MKLPENTGAYGWGAAVGAIALAIVGFSWGGWVTGGTATKDAERAGRCRRLGACTDLRRALQDPGRRGRQDRRTRQGKYLGPRHHGRQNGGSALMPGSKDADPDVARACAEMLVNPTTPKT